MQSDHFNLEQEYRRAYESALKGMRVSKATPNTSPSHKPNPALVRFDEEMKLLDKQVTCLEEVWVALYLQDYGIKEVALETH